MEEFVEAAVDLARHAQRFSMPEGGIDEHLKNLRERGKRVVTLYAELDSHRCAAAS